MVLEGVKTGVQKSRKWAVSANFVSKEVRVERGGDGGSGGIPLPLVSVKEVFDRAGSG